MTRAEEHDEDRNDKVPVTALDASKFDGTYETCRMGIIGTNWKGDKICYRPGDR